MNLSENYRKNLKETENIDLGDREDILLMYNPVLKKSVMFIKKDNKWYSSDEGELPEEYSSQTASDIRDEYIGNWKRIMSVHEDLDKLFHKLEVNKGKLTESENYVINYETGDKESTDGMWIFEYYGNLKEAKEVKEAFIKTGYKSFIQQVSYEYAVWKSWEPVSGESEIDEGEGASDTKYYVVYYPESNDFCAKYKNFTKYKDAYNYLITHVDAEKIFECYNSKSGEYIEKLDKVRDLEDKGKLPISSEREAYLQKVEEDELDEGENEMKLSEAYRKNLNEAIEPKYNKSNEEYNKYLKDVKYYTGSYNYLFGGKVDTQYDGENITIKYFYYERPFANHYYQLVVNVLTPLNASISIGNEVQDAIEEAFDELQYERLTNKEIKTKILEVVNSLNGSLNENAAIDDLDLYVMHDAKSAETEEDINSYLGNYPKVKGVIVKVGDKHSDDIWDIDIISTEDKLKDYLVNTLNYYTDEEINDEYRNIIEPYYNSLLGMEYSEIHNSLNEGV